MEVMRQFDLDGELCKTDSSQDGFKQVKLLTVKLNVGRQLSDEQLAARAQGDYSVAVYI